MHKVSRLLACFACVSLGSCAQSSGEHLEANRLTALTKLLLEPELEAAFNPVNAGGRLHKLEGFERRRGQRDSVMKASGSPIRRRDMMTALAVLAALPAREAIGMQGAVGNIPNVQVKKVPKEFQVPPPPSKTSCKNCIPTDDELNRLAVGYKRLNFLLANWDAQTTTCKVECLDPLSCGCDRDPLIVQNFLGFKSIKDPLFEADKLMMRAQLKVSDDDFEEFTKIYKKYKSKTQQGSVMAYVSSWGEANPGGGKDKIEKYFEQTKTDVVEVRDILKKMCDMLQVQV